MQYTDLERAYAALHDDYTNGLLDRDAYLAAFEQLKPQQKPARLRIMTWLIIGAVAIILVAIYVAQVGAL
jgi:hypothetical protein